MLQTVLPGFLTVFTSAGFSFNGAAYARHKALWLLEARLQVLNLKILSVPTTKRFVSWKCFRPQVDDRHSFVWVRSQPLRRPTMHTDDLAVHIRYA
jgi:hypothetical protein